MPVKIGSPDFGKTTLLRIQKTLGLGYFDVLSPRRRVSAAEALAIADRAAFYREVYRVHMAERARWSAAVANSLFSVWIEDALADGASILTRK